MFSPNDVYVAVKGGRKSIKNSVGSKSKDHVWDLRIDRILFNVQMHGSDNTGLYRVSDLKGESSMFQHSKRIRWLQRIVKR